MVAQALVSSGLNPDKFARSLAWRLRLWLLGIPAGIGLATLKSILRLWIGYGPKTSGVFSAGNGPAMRAAVLGAAIDDREALRELVSASSKITHSDPRADYGAFAVALAAQMSRLNRTVSGQSFLEELRATLNCDADEFLFLISQVVDSVASKQPTRLLAESLGLANGVTGYVYRTVPIAIHAWLTSQNDYRMAITSVISCGGDTDTTAAIVGGIVGAGVGKSGISGDWLNGLVEWPRTVNWMERLAGQVDSVIKSNTGVRPIGLPFWGVLPRNIIFLVVVLFHGIRRLLPPYSS
jgi:ADP-ribosylglycohydrolase